MFVALTIFYAVNEIIKRLCGMVFLTNLEVTLNDKAMKKLILILVLAMSFASCRNADKEAAIEDKRQASIDSMKVEMEKKDAEAARQRTIDSMRAIAAQKQATEKVVVVDNTGQPAQPQRKKWSGAAKGAVIGAGVGAVTGAIIDKDKPAQGAVIGGLAGAGVGAGTGAIIDDSKKKKQKK